MRLEHIIACIGDPTLKMLEPWRTYQGELQIADENGLREKCITVNRVGVRDPKSSLTSDIEWQNLECAL